MRVRTVENWHSPVSATGTMRGSRSRADIPSVHRFIAHRVSEKMTHIVNIYNTGRFFFFSEKKSKNLKCPSSRRMFRVDSLGIEGCITYGKLCYNMTLKSKVVIYYSVTRIVSTASPLGLMRHSKHKLILPTAKPYCCVPSRQASGNQFMGTVTSTHGASYTPGNTSHYMSSKSPRAVQAGFEPSTSYYLPEFTAGTLTTRPRLI